MHMRLGCPREGEQADGENHAGDAAKWKTLLRGEGNAAAGDKLAHVAFIVENVRRNRLVTDLLVSANLLRAKRGMRKSVCTSRTIITPTPIGMNASPETPGDQPRAAS